MLGRSFAQGRLGRSELAIQRQQFVYLAHPVSTAWPKTLPGLLSASTSRRGGSVRRPPHTEPTFTSPFDPSRTFSDRRAEPGGRAIALLR
jgi:hypothetical protein